MTLPISRSDRDRSGALTRRTLLQAPVAGAAVVAGAGAAQAEEPKAAPADPLRPGYRTTPHVEAYYARLRG